MNEGDVVLVPLPQANGQIKNRPALVLRKMPPYQDLLVCGISTQLHQEVQGFDDLMNLDDADFAESGRRPLFGSSSWRFYLSKVSLESSVRWVRVGAKNYYEGWPVTSLKTLLDWVLQGLMNPEARAASSPPDVSLTEQPHTPRTQKVPK